MSTSTPDPDEPELTEVEIEMRYPSKGDSHNKPYLIVSFDALAAILYRESGTIAPEDVPHLLYALSGYAERAGHGDRHAVTMWEVHANRLLIETEIDEDDDGEEDKAEDA